MAIKKKIGRPSDFSPAMADMICERIAEGESLRKICAGENMPRQPTVFRWLVNNDEFRKQYALARESQADAIFDEAIDIADDASNDWMERNNPDNPGWQANGENVQRSKLRIDTRKWMAGKLNAKKYGDRVINEVGGIDGKPIEFEPRPPRELAKMILGIIQLAQRQEATPTESDKLFPFQESETHD